MNARAFRSVLVAVGLALLGAVTGLRAAEPGGASAWDRGGHSALRLIGGTASASETLRAGLEIELASGWKTYWRYPGDSGVPPEFDFSASRNLRDLQVQWPAPKRVPDGAGYAIGYESRVVLPLRVTPQDPKAPVELRLKVMYAVCEKICVPVHANAALDLPVADSKQEPALEASEARVPRRVPLGQDGPLRILGIHRDNGERARIRVDVASTDPDVTDLFAEGPTPDWSLPLPARIGSPEHGIVQFAFDLDGLPPGAQAAGATLTLTAVAPQHAIEVTARLD
jgi:DsbC/DsbD-like thiol-disulfide interchange protein